MKIGDRVHYYPGTDDALPALNSTCLLALVCYLHTDGSVNLAVSSAYGHVEGRHHIEVKDAPDGSVDGHYCVSIEPDVAPVIAAYTAHLQFQEAAPAEPDPAQHVLPGMVSTGDGQADDGLLVAPTGSMGEEVHPASGFSTPMLPDEFHPPAPSQSPDQQDAAAIQYPPVLNDAVVVPDTIDGAPNTAG